MAWEMPFSKKLRPGKRPTLVRGVLMDGSIRYESIPPWRHMGRHWYTSVQFIK